MIKYTKRNIAIASAATFPRSLKNHEKNKQINNACWVGYKDTQVRMTRDAYTKHG